MKTYPLPIHVQRFFTERLATQLHASPNTVASYRDTFRLLLRYAADRLKREPTQLQIADLDADLIGGFLTFVETRRGNGARSRNTRLSAIRSFFKYVAVNEPQLLHHCQRVLAMPSKRYEKRTIDYLTHAEIESARPGSRSHHLGWPAPSHPASACPADGTSGLGVSQSDLWRRCARRRRPRSMHGQGTQGAIDAASERLCEGPSRLARRARRC